MISLISKIMVATIIVCACVSLVIYWLRILTGNENFDPIEILYMGAFLLFLEPFIFIFFAPPKEKSRKYFSFLEEKYLEQGNEWLTERFGLDIVEKLIMDEQNLIPFQGIDICLELIEKSNQFKNPKFTSHLYYRLSDNYYRDGQYKNAADSIKKALEFDPENLFLNLMASIFYEYIGKREETIKYYETALNISKDNYPNIKKHITSNIERIKSNGLKPRKPPSGKKWMAG